MWEMKYITANNFTYGFVIKVDNDIQSNAHHFANDLKEEPATITSMMVIHLLATSN